MISITAFRLPALLLAVTGIIVGSCQRKQENDIPSRPELVRLAKANYAIGDLITVQLDQPLTAVTIRWDDKALTTAVITEKAISFQPAATTVGIHQVVVSGRTAIGKPVSDTLSVELWSDIKPERLTYTVLQTYPHQRSSFTQGLEFYKDTLYEGTGLNGQSKLMKVNLLTGEIIQSVSLPNQYFGEGITVLNDRVYQLTWTSGQCFQYSTDLVLKKTFVYHTQGWGLTHKDTTLIVSDGSNRLSYYSPDFVKTGELSVYDNTGPVTNLNELEYINGYVLANVWQTNRIVQIDLHSGKVVGELSIDPNIVAGVDTKEDVLNGIAYKTKENALFITGKNWPSLFRLQVKKLLNAAPRNRTTLQ